MKARFSYVSILTLGTLPGIALAQLDNSTYPTFKVNSVRPGAVVAPGPAQAHAWTLSGIGSTTAGGTAIAANGDIYFKTQDNGTTRVYRVSPAGTILATSPVFGAPAAGNGHHSGVAVGVNAVYTTIAPFGDTNRVVVLDKSTLAVVNSYTNAAFVSLRGTPCISTFANSNTGDGTLDYTLYVGDRGGKKIHAVDAASGVVRWSHTFLGTEPLFDQVGPLWVVGGRQRLGYFRRDNFFAGFCLEDNGDSTPPTQVWEGGPDSFNWFGSGALSADSTRIYVTTFNDANAPALWAIDVNNGATIWSVPGNRDQCDDRNFFSRPCVIGNRIYCGGGGGVIACFIDNGPTATLAWESRDGRGEYTGISAVQTPAGERFVYAVLQESPTVGLAEYVVLRDDGASFTQLVRTDLGGALKFSFNSGNTPAIAADGSVYFGSGRYTDAAGFDLYKFTLGPPPPGRGRCCLSNGNCSILTQAACTAAGGTYGGDNSNCNATNPTVHTSNPNLAIPDNDPVGVTDTINVAGGGTIGDLNVTVTVPDHTFVQDLVIRLTHGVTTVTLWNHACGGQDGMSPTFDDEGQGVTCICGLSGNIMTVGAGAGALSAFDGQSSSGAWTLNVADEFEFDTGSLASWSLIVGPPGDPCGAGGCPNPGGTNNFCSADLNGDCQISLADLTLVLSAFGSVTGDPNYDPAADYDNDGAVDLQDLATLLGQFGDNCS